MYYQQNPTGYPAPYGYGQTFSQPQPSNNRINWCQGIEGAKSFFVPPGQSAQIMDSESPYFYIKSVDQSGIPSPLRVFRYSEEFVQPQAAQSDYVTRQELPQLVAQALAAMQQQGGNDNNA